MRPIIYLFSLVVSVVSLCSCVNVSIVPQKLTGPELAAIETNETVALVYTNGEGEVHPFCSAVWVGEKILLSANHCVEGLAEHLSESKGKDVDPNDLSIDYIVPSEVVNPGQNPTITHSSYVMALNKKADLALLMIIDAKPVPKHSIARLAAKAPYVGEHISIMGHPAGNYFTYIDGVVAAYRLDLSDMGMHFADGPFIQVCAPVWFGNSGGGLFNDKGELIGIASFIERAPSTGYFVYLETIRSWLQGEHIAPVYLNPNQPDPSL